MQVDLKQDGLDLCAAGPLRLAMSRRKTGVIANSVRIGLTRNVDSKLRFYERGNPCIKWSKEVARVVRGKPKHSCISVWSWSWLPRVWA